MKPTLWKVQFCLEKKQQEQSLNRFFCFAFIKSIGQIIGIDP
jgi:hypothetical protein